MISSESLFRIIGELDAQRLEYALAGGFAYSLHVVPRATVDIDIVAVGRSLDQIEKAMGRVFTDVIRHKNAMRLSRMALYRIIGVQENEETVLDVIVPENESLTAGILSRRIAIDIEGRSVYVVSLEDLYILKHFSTRLQDRSDCEMIEKLHGQDMDREYINQWV